MDARKSQRNLIEYSGLGVSSRLTLYPKSVFGLFRKNFHHENLEGMDTTLHDESNETN